MLGSSGSSYYEKFGRKPISCQKMERKPISCQKLKRNFLLQREDLLDLDRYHFKFPWKFGLFIDFLLCLSKLCGIKMQRKPNSCGKVDGKPELERKWTQANVLSKNQTQSVFLSKINLDPVSSKKNDDFNRCQQNFSWKISRFSSCQGPNKLLTKIEWHPVNNQSSEQISNLILSLQANTFLGSTWKKISPHYHRKSISPQILFISLKPISRKTYAVADLAGGLSGR